MRPAEILQSIITIVFLFIVAVGLSCDKKSDSAKIIFEEETYNCGVLEKNSLSAVHEFKFRNEGSAPLAIANIATSCNCIITEAPTENILPGDAGKILFTANLSRRLGPQLNKIFVHSNDPARPVVGLTLTARATLDVVIDIDKIDLGEVLTGNTTTGEFSISLPMEKRIRTDNDMLSFVTSSDGLSVTISDTSSVRTQWNEYLKVFVCQVNFVASENIGPIRENITIFINEKETQTELPVVARILGKIKVEPETLILGVVNNGERVTNRIKMSSPKTHMFRVLDAHCVNETISVNPLRISTNTYELEIHFEPHKIPLGLFRSEIVVRTNEKKQKVICIPVYGWLS